jgi:ABC-type bacteriocin/lantibiotic exporter with double-glycine peptidase domain
VAIIYELTIYELVSLSISLCIYLFLSLYFSFIYFAITHYSFSFLSAHLYFSPFYFLLTDFSQFLRTIQIQRELEKRNQSESDLVSAFVSLGGGKEKDGSINSDRLRKIIKEDYNLTFKIDEFLDDIELEHDGMLNFNEFRQLFA